MLGVGALQNVKNYGSRHYSRLFLVAKVLKMEAGDRSVLPQQLVALTNIRMDLCLQFLASSGKGMLCSP